MTKTVVLMDGRNGEVWCELRLLEEESGTLGRAEILRGTFGAQGDVVGKPAELSWSEAACLVTPGKTALSPLDLYSIEERARPAIDDGTLLEDLEDKRGDWNDALTMARDNQDLIKALDEALADPAAGDASRTPPARRRESDHHAA